MLVKCPNCKGARKLMSIGGMYKACPHCQGAGQIEVEEKKEPTFTITTETVKTEIDESAPLTVVSAEIINSDVKISNKKTNIDSKGKKGTK